MNQMRSKYLLYFCDGIGSVFDSQVLALLNALNEKSIFIKIYLFLGIRNEVQKNEVLSKKSIPEIEIVFYKTYPNYQYFNLLIRKSISDALHSQSIDCKKIIFHTRGEMIAWHLSRVIGEELIGNILPDVRGASVEEIEDYYDSNKIIKSIKINNYKKALSYIKKFNKISAVSNSLKEHLITNYDIDPEKIVITPCLAGNDFKYNMSKRSIIRNKLNLSSDDTMLIFSSGGTANWQNNEVLLKLAEKGIRVLNLSKMEINHKNIVNKFVSNSEMHLYLNAADAAIIWRDDSVVNKVASPVKFSEYVCCGLPVIANKSVAMISEYISNHSCGMLLDNLDSINLKTINDLKQKDRYKISKEGILYFGIGTIVNKYIETYYSFE